MQQPSRLQLLQLRIFPKLAARQEGFAVVWWYARHVDQLSMKPSGKAEICIDIASAMLGKKPSTIKAYLRSSHKAGLFRYLKIRDNVATVYYASLERVAEKYQLDSLGASGYVKPHELEHMRFLITEVQAEILQQQSLYAMYEEQKELQKENGRTVCNNLTDIFDLESCNISRGYSSNVIYRGGRCVFVDSRFTAFGASQATIARNLGVSERTVRSRLSNKTRERYNERRSEKGKSTFRLVLKRQLALERTERKDFEELKIAAVTSDDVSLFNHLTNEEKRHYSFGERQYRLGCNVYLFTKFDLNSSKAKQYYFATKQKQKKAGDREQ